LIILKTIFYFLLPLLFIGVVHAAPYASWHLDELGNASTSYILTDDQAGHDGTAYATPSTGNTGGKICSALDFSSSSTSDYAVLNKDSLNGATDFTTSIWHKSNSNNRRAILSGARAGQDNEILFWIKNDSTQFDAFIKDVIAPSITFPTIADNQWHHLVWRRSVTQSCFFTDGVQRGCNTVQSKALIIESLVLAQEQDNVGGGFNASQDWEGIVDELLIFRRALDNTAISSIYNNQNTGKNWDGGYRAPCLPQYAKHETHQNITSNL